MIPALISHLAHASQTPLRNTSLYYRVGVSGAHREKGYRNTPHQPTRMLLGAVLMRLL